LDEVDADEGGEKQPPGADPMAEGEAGEDHGAGEDADAIFEFHRREELRFTE